jgi:hypothetical protein
MQSRAYLMLSSTRTDRLDAIDLFPLLAQSHRRSGVAGTLISDPFATSAAMLRAA